MLDDDVFSDEVIKEYIHQNGFEGLRISKESIQELKKVLINTAYIISTDAKYFANKRGKATIRKQDILKAYEKWKKSHINENS